MGFERWILPRVVIVLLESGSPNLPVSMCPMTPLVVLVLKVLLAGLQMLYLGTEVLLVGLELVDVPIVLRVGRGGLLWRRRWRRVAAQHFVEHVGVLIARLPLHRGRRAPHGARAIPRCAVVRHLVRAARDADARPGTVRQVDARGQPAGSWAEEAVVELRSELHHCSTGTDEHYLLEKKGMPHCRWEWGMGAGGGGGSLLLLARKALRSSGGQRAHLHEPR